MCGLLCIERRSTEWLAAGRNFRVRRAAVIPCSTTRFDIWGVSMPQPRPGSAANSSSKEATVNQRFVACLPLTTPTRSHLVTILLAGIDVIAAWQCLFAGAPTAIAPVRRTRPRQKVRRVDHQRLVRRQCLVTRSSRWTEAVGALATRSDRGGDQTIGQVVCRRVTLHLAQCLVGGSRTAASASGQPCR
jgi:hypothetical protein